MGARPMQRVFDQHIKKPISKELLFGKLMNGGKVKVDAVNNDLDIKYEHKA
jgi:ATP-dependent Clp protease ATP-binding subunit ClpA